ncbi:MAG TPA: ATP-binding protein, partial [Gemmatimonadaceae bacterium]|nr:ATP-binding protein [Gemmatimonadaceae bacterium]
MAPINSDPIRLRIAHADAETRALIASLLTSHTGRTYIVEPIEGGEGFAGMPATASEAERRASEALRESEAQLAAVLADRERLERQFYQAQKMETVGQLAGGIAHDFNNILTAIVGFGTLVSEQVSENEAASRNAAEILAAANRASALTRQLLAFGRRQVLHPTRVNLNETVHSLAGMLCQLIGENIDLRIVCAPDIPPIRADLSQLESALANLVINARDAMPRGGRLTIETADVVLDDDYCATHVGVRPGRYARLSVSDTGIGMSQDLQARIFEPFFTTKDAGKGSGLGLATVYGIVKQS